MISKNILKKEVGWSALKYIQPNTIVGVGTGSTISHFIDALATIKHNINGVVSSSRVSSSKLKRLGIPMFDLNDIDYLDIYIDGADEINDKMQMIKGGGAALTREKIIASVAHKFVCIIDFSKQVKILGKFPLPVEVIPMARTWVAKEFINMGGMPKCRQKIITDNGNIILDIYNLRIEDAVKFEEKINNIPGIVTVGLFAKRSADIVLIGTEQGVKILY